MPDDDRYDLGILFVHGIGEQTRGATLTEFGTPLVEWLARTAGATVGEATITEDDGEPARAEILLTRGEQRWLMAESWWANAFHMPPFAELARWGFAVAPWTIGSHFGERLRQIWRRKPRGRLGPMLRWLKLAFGFLSLLGGVVMSIGVSIALVLLLWVSFIPWQRLRDVVMGQQRRISSWLGDSYLFVVRPIEFAAIVSRVRRDLEWLSACCDRVAVVAHSQGAAVACHTLAGGEAVPRLLLTFGSGLRKLEQQRYIRRYPQLIRGAGLTVAGVLLTCTTPLLISRSLQLIRESGFATLDEIALIMIFPAAGLGFLIGGLFDFLTHRDPETLAQLRREIGARKVEWTDFFASADPVPNGDLEPMAGIPPLSAEVVNAGSLFADHGAYWRNRDVFVSHVGNALLRFAGWPADGVPQDLLNKLSVRRVRRVRVLRILWSATMAAIAAMFIRHADAWSAVARWTLSTLPDFLREIFGIGDALFPEDGEWWRSVGALLAATVGYGVVRSGWDTLNDGEMRVIYEPARRNQSLLNFSTSIAVHVTILVIAVMATTRPWIVTAALAVGFLLARYAIPSAEVEPDAPEMGPQPMTTKVLSFAVQAYVLLAAGITLISVLYEWSRKLSFRIERWGVLSPAARVGTILVLALVAVLILGFAIGGVITLVQRRAAKKKKGT